MKPLNIYINENIINEHFVTPTTKEEMYKYAPQVWDILVKSYEYCGGLAGIDSVDQLIEETTLWKLVRRNEVVTAVCTYTTKRGGRKSCYIGSLPTEQGVHDLLMILKEDAKLLDREAWSESSGKAVGVKLKNGWCPIPNVVAQQIMKDKHFDELCDDGYFYVREIDGKKYHKIMLGNYNKERYYTDDNLINTLKEISKKYFAIDEEENEE